VDGKGEYALVSYIKGFREKGLKIESRELSESDRMMNLFV